MAAFVTPTDVSNLTGKLVGESDIVQAQGIIELFCGRNSAVFQRLRSGDRRWLKMAIAYQTAWMQDHPEIFSAMDVDSLQQLDLRVNFREGDRDAPLIAPLARKAIKRCSWKGTRSISLNSDFQGRRDPDDALAWVPLR